MSYYRKGSESSNLEQLLMVLPKPWFLAIQVFKNFIDQSIWSTLSYFKIVLHEVAALRLVNYLFIVENIDRNILFSSNRWSGNSDGMFSFFFLSYSISFDSTFAAILNSCEQHQKHVTFNHIFRIIFPRSKTSENWFTMHGICNVGEFYLYFYFGF